MADSFVADSFTPDGPAQDSFVADSFVPDGPSAPKRKKDAAELAANPDSTEALAMSGLGPSTPPTPIQKATSVIQPEVTAKPGAFTNPRTGKQYARPEQGTGAGPERILDLPLEGVMDVTEGNRKLTSNRSTFDDRLRGLSEMNRGALKTISPFMIPALAAAAPGATVPGVLGGLGRLTAGGLAAMGTRNALTPAGKAPSGAAEFTSDLVGNVALGFPYAKPLAATKDFLALGTAGRPREIAASLGVEGTEPEIRALIGNIQKVHKLQNPEAPPIETAEALHKAAVATAKQTSQEGVTPWFNRGEGAGTTFSGKNIADNIVADLPEGLQLHDPVEYQKLVAAIHAEWDPRVLSVGEGRKLNNFYNNNGGTFWDLTRAKQLTAEAAQAAKAMYAAYGKALRREMYPKLNPEGMEEIPAQAAQKLLQENAAGTSKVVPVQQGNKWMIPSPGADIRRAQSVVGKASELADTLEPMLTTSVGQRPKSQLDEMMQWAGTPAHVLFTNFAGPAYKAVSMAQNLSKPPARIDKIVRNLLRIEGNPSKLPRPSELPGGLDTSEGLRTSRKKMIDSLAQNWPVPGGPVPRPMRLLGKPTIKAGPISEGPLYDAEAQAGPLMGLDAQGQPGPLPGPQSGPRTMAVPAMEPSATPIRGYLNKPTIKAGAIPDESFVGSVDAMEPSAVPIRGLFGEPTRKAGAVPDTSFVRSVPAQGPVRTGVRTLEAPTRVPQGGFATGTTNDLVPVRWFNPTTNRFELEYVPAREVGSRALGLPGTMPGMPMRPSKGRFSQFTGTESRVP